jgi:probable O-glycosylation ligase (exosortase A-associated)
MRDILVVALVFGSLPLILKRPWFGIIVWTWLGFMNPHRLSWGFAQTMPVAMIVALTTLIGMLLSREPKKVPWTRESLLLLLFVLWMTLTTFFAQFPTFAWEQWEKVAKIQLMIFVAMMLITSRERLHLLVWTIAVSIGFYGVKGGIFTILHGGVHRVYGPDGTFIGDNNSMGMALTMTIPLMYYLYQESSRRYVRLGLLAAMVLTALAAFGTHSRGALLGMVAMGVVLWWKSRHKIFMAIVVAAGAATVFLFMPQEWFDRMMTIKTYEADASVQGRFYAWNNAYNIAVERFFGGGFETFRGNIDAHSIYFEVLGEHGFVGLALFIALGLFSWMAASRIRRQTEKSDDMAWMARLMRMTQVSLVAYATAGAFLGMAYYDYAYNLVLIVIVCTAILAQSASSKAAVSATRQTTAPRPSAGTAAVIAGRIGR